MKGRIDTATVQKILDTADIVDVVSDYVRLRRRGSGYIGLCPFHNERTPSFSVSKSKSFCKCFSCGKGGSPVSFIMEIEQLTYPEALRFLAKKYNIEISEEELTPEEQDKENRRQSLFALNDFALKHFEHNLLMTSEGKNIGYAYFRERGINDKMIEKFHLGYSLEQRDALYEAAIQAGYSEKYIEESGLCLKREAGGWRDRFRSRVMYPIFTISGKVVGFGGRTLRKDKDVAKYVNSPESDIYKKSYELYGLYQAKSSIVKKDTCILVEGYMDVISMHQAGVENVVASSGTSLTEGQIRLIHRFTENIIVIYDSDPAGIKASLRGIDMLLAEGMKVKVLLLPEGDDPDSFAQNHSSTEVEEYIQANQSDFITFKTKILLSGVENDPISRSKVITDIVRSISVIPDQIMRTVYIGECSRLLGIDEKVLALQVTKFMADKADRDYTEAQREKNLKAIKPELDEEDPSKPEQIATPAQNNSFISPYERELLRYVVRYGLVYLGDIEGENPEELMPFNVLEYVQNSLRSDDITFSTEKYRITFDYINDFVAKHWAIDNSRFKESLEEKKKTLLEEGFADIKRTAVDLSDINRLENELKSNVDKEIERLTAEFETTYLVKNLVSSPDDTVREVATDLADEKHKLSKIHTKYSVIETEKDKLKDLVPMAYYNLQEAIIETLIKDLLERIRVESKAIPRNDELIIELMKKHSEFNEMKKELARYLGERIVAPRVRR
ncbi:MAG: DNA primase [Paramuribaculum sp.]|nr:DNA primase [Paramuribaculum sp.]